MIYYNTCNSWFTAAIFEDWFFNHFIPEVQRYQEDVLHIPPDEVKAILRLDNAPAHPHADKLVSRDQSCVFDPNTTSLIQPMDQGVIMATKRIYTRKYLDEVLVVIPDEDDEIEDTRGLHMLEKIKSYNIKSGIYNFASAWKQVKISTLANCWKNTPSGHRPRARLRRLRTEGLPPGVSGVRRTGGVARSCRKLAR